MIDYYSNFLFNPVVPQTPFRGPNSLKCEEGIPKGLKEFHFLFFSHACKGITDIRQFLCFGRISKNAGFFYRLPGLSHISHLD
jgi:hypothetical protein